jgi:hypothetical protein
LDALPSGQLPLSSQNEPEKNGLISLTLAFGDRGPSLRGTPGSEVAFKHFCPDVLGFNLTERDTANRPKMVMLVSVDSTRDTSDKSAKSGNLYATHATRQEAYFSV